VQPLEPPSAPLVWLTAMWNWQVGMLPVAPRLQQQQLQEQLPLPLQQLPSVLVLLTAKWCWQVGKLPVALRLQQQQLQEQLPFPLY